MYKVVQKTVFAPNFSLFYGSESSREKFESKELLIHCSLSSVNLMTSVRYTNLAEKVYQKTKKNMEKILTALTTVFKLELNRTLWAASQSSKC